MIRQVLISQSRDCFFNLALEEYLVRTINFTDSSLLLIYVNEESIILGKNQNIYKEVYLPVLLDKTVRVSRRISGGGTVVHDAGNINFAFFENYELKKVNNYASSIGFMIEVLKSLGIDCYQNERNAIFLANGKKISGSAQFSTKNGILSHFSLLYQSNLQRIEECIQPNKYIISSKSSASVRSEIANLGDTISLSQAEFIESIAKMYSPEGAMFKMTSDQLQSVSALAVQKYSNEEYIFHTSGTGIISSGEITIELEKGIIRELTGLNSFTHYLGKRLNYDEIPSSDPLWTFLI
jgi:lipoate---protein ligase